ncbi:hypothetical protein EV702DRAFT_1196926 [Suillus placidus]|uniref:Uncharacterized protein n=1 Tax=Suillus placidus TaxID=48579 RepID=A0A9P6ZVV2_9AGAM|nr:hypothetical protein EV702DRAFT_1196926 [Suillus placidus]
MSQPWLRSHTQRTTTFPPIASALRLALFFNLNEVLRFIMPMNIPLALLSCALSAPPSVVTHDVWAPTITPPSPSDSLWTIGEAFLVTWDMSSEPSEVINPTGETLS